MSAYVGRIDGEGATVVFTARALPLLPVAWVAVLLGGFWLRLGALDALPLAPDEAARALEALAIWRGEAGEYRAGPVLPNLVAVWLALFSPADGPARAPSALAGWALCLTPLLYRERIGMPSALGAGCLLAISPLAVLASRSVHPAVFATLAAAALVGCLVRAFDRSDGRWLLGAGLAVGLGLGTTHLFVGQVMAIVLALAVWPPVERTTSFDAPRWAGRAILVGLAGALVVDTLLFTRPGGVQAGLVEPLALWLASVGWSALAPQAGAMLGLHELGLLGLATYGGIVGREDRRLVGFLAAWAAAAIILALLTRAPDLTPFVGATVPLALLGGRGLARLGWMKLGRRTAIWLSALAALVPVVFLVLAINGAVQRGGAPSFAPLLIASGGLIAIVLVAGAWLDRLELAVAGGLALAAILAALWLTSLVRLNFASHERAGPALFGQSSRPELYELRDIVQGWWRQDPNGVIRVDVSLRPLLEWTMRDGPPVEWVSGPPATAERAILGGLTAANRPAGDWVRYHVAERYQPPAETINPAALWRWFVQRQPFVSIEPHAILVPH